MEFQPSMSMLGNVNVTMSDVNSLYRIADCVGLCNARSLLNIRSRN